VSNFFLPAFKSISCPADDQAVLQLNRTQPAFTTDSFTVTPIFFPGGDIGRLAINGAVNDLAMSGAKPLHFAGALILGDSLALDDPARIVNSMREAALEGGVRLVTGDTQLPRRNKRWHAFKRL
jgi:hydrogenase expression/formation protein HypE